MGPKMTWNNIHIDHLKPISSFGVSKDEELNEEFNRRIAQAFLKEVHQHEGTKIIFLDYRLQFIKTYEFIKLTEEGYNKEFYQ